MQSMSSCAPFVYVTACENAVAQSDLRTIAQCFGASQVQHHRAFYSRKEPNLLLDFYSSKAKKKNPVTIGITGFLMELVM